MQRRFDVRHERDLLRADRLLVMQAMPAGDQACHEEVPPGQLRDPSRHRPGHPLIGVRTVDPLIPQQPQGGQGVGGEILDREVVPLV